MTPVRLATSEDFDAVTALLEQLGRPEVSDADREGCRAVYEAQLDDPHAAHVVAEDDEGRVVGVCTLHFRRRLNHLTREAWVPDLIVADGLRGQGVGTALLAEAVRLSEEHGCHALELESAHFREEAHEFYRAFGLDQPGLTFGKPLV